MLLNAKKLFREASEKSFFDAIAAEKSEKKSKFLESYFLFWYSAKNAKKNLKTKRQFVRILRKMCSLNNISLENGDLTTIAWKIVT